MMAGSCIADLLIILIGGNRLLHVLMPQVADAAPDGPAHGSPLQVGSIAPDPARHAWF